MAEKTEKVGNTKAAVQAAKIIQGAATAGLPGAAIATISDPKASFALVKKILIAVTVIIMLPTIIISSIPSSIINLISIDQTQDSSSSQVFESKYDEFLTGFQCAVWPTDYNRERIHPTVNDRRRISGRCGSCPVHEADPAERQRSDVGAVPAGERRSGSPERGGSRPSADA